MSNDPVVDPSAAGDPAPDGTTSRRVAPNEGLLAFVLDDGKLFRRFMIFMTWLVVSAWVSAIVLSACLAYVAARGVPIELGFPVATATSASAASAATWVWIKLGRRRREQDPRSPPGMAPTNPDQGS